MGEVTSAEVIGEARGGATIKIRAVIDDKSYIGEMRKSNREMLQPIFRDHKEEIMKMFKSAEIAKYLLFKFEEDPVFIESLERGDNK
ncbi:hypothetical protein [Bacillus thuringiensis]|uniref:Uncharacterized protein n=1 Tax=Bacillus thuringiensis subsp. jegathesan TaxID=56955 RepID=A0A9X6MCH0_BACTJ|nr:hypothetical protein [Bacillus thuringiensis]OUB71855.1 hypothetical protein BK750_09770 [Bacillus thuringiensis serovar jegathesan]